MFLNIEIPNEIAPILAGVLRGTESLISIKRKYGVERAVLCMSLRNKILANLESCNPIIGEGI